MTLPTYFGCPRCGGFLAWTPRYRRASLILNCLAPGCPGPDAMEAYRMVRSAELFPDRTTWPKAAEGDDMTTTETTRAPHHEVEARLGITPIAKRDLIAAWLATGVGPFESWTPKDFDQAVTALGEQLAAVELGPNGATRGSQRVAS